MDRAKLIAAMQATADKPPVKVETKAWGTVWVRQVTVAEADEQQAEADAEGDAKKTRLARGACRVICDETGHRVFDANKKEDVDLLARQPWAQLRQVLAAAEDDSGNVSPPATSS